MIRTKLGFALSLCIASSFAIAEDYYPTPYEWNFASQHQGLSQRLDNLEEWQLDYDLSIRRNDYAAVIDWQVNSWGARATAGISSHEDLLNYSVTNSLPYLGVGWSSKGLINSPWSMSVDLGTSLSFEQTESEDPAYENERFGIDILTNTKLSLGFQYQF